MDDRFFRNSMGKFATGVTVITAEVDEEVHGMTANSFVSVSLNPKLVLVSVDKKAKILRFIQESKKFAISFLSVDQQTVSMRFAGQLKVEQPFNFGRFSEMPVVKDSLATITCTVYNEVDAGDHVLFIGEVNNLKVKEGDPLLFFQGKYRKLAANEQLID
jgi:flavin reductase (DIM6/NTAB) family NADH-FMN oxidoreductase RutF